MDISKIEILIEEAIKENESLFLVELDVLSDNKIYIEIDADKSLPIKECVRVSKYIYKGLNFEKESFSLEVTTPDISLPIKVKRQYKKNIGRILTVITNEGEKIEGNLVSLTDKDISLSWKTRVPKQIGKGKITVKKNKTIPFEGIKQSKVKILF